MSNVILNIHIKDSSDTIPFNDTFEFYDYLSMYENENCIWLAKGSGEFSDIFITEYFHSMVSFFKRNLSYFLQESMMVYLQEYQTFEDTYAVALYMKEGNLRQ